MKNCMLLERKHNMKDTPEIAYILIEFYKVFAGKVHDRDEAQHSHRKQLDYLNYQVIIS